MYQEESTNISHLYTRTCRGRNIRKCEIWRESDNFFHFMVMDLLWRREAPEVIIPDSHKILRMNVYERFSYSKFSTFVGEVHDGRVVPNSPFSHLTVVMINILGLSWNKKFFLFEVNYFLWICWTFFLKTFKTFSGGPTDKKRRFQDKYPKIY